MKTTQKIAGFLLAGLLVLTAYGLYHTAKPAFNAPEKPLVPTAGNAPLVDESTLRTAQKLVQLADKPEEQQLATEAIRLADHELDLAFAAAQREAKAHPAALNEEAKEIQIRLEKAQSNQKQEQAEVAQLTAEAANATGSKKQALEDRLEAVKAELELTDDEVDDASQDLVRAGGDTKWRLEQLAEEHKATSASVDNAAPLKINYIGFRSARSGAQCADVFPHQLHHVFVIRDDQNFQILFRGLHRQTADHVVRFKSLKLQHRQLHGFAQTPHVRNLQRQFVRHRRALRLVLIK